MIGVYVGGMLIGGRARPAQHHRGMGARSA